VAFEFRKLRFNYHPESNGFERLRFPVHEPFSYYLKASGYGHGDKVAAAVAQWGLNKFEVRRERVRGVRCGEVWSVVWSVRRGQVSGALQCCQSAARLNKMMGDWLRYGQWIRPWRKSGSCCGAVGADQV
jgi:hypothetical protein